jgi:hypothetical protein
MATAATDGSVIGEWVAIAPATDAPVERHKCADWLSLRLFGAGRRPGAFEAGAEALARL